MKSRFCSGFSLSSFGLLAGIFNQGMGSAEDGAREPANYAARVHCADSERRRTNGGRGGGQQQPALLVAHGGAAARSRGSGSRRQRPTCTCGTHGLQAGSAAQDPARDCMPAQGTWLRSGRVDAAGPARKAKPAAASRPATVAQQGHDQDPAPAGHQAFGARGP